MQMFASSKSLMLLASGRSVLTRNVRVNVKIGGINTIPEASSVTALTDPHHPTVVFGADVVHPAPGTEGRPSFTSVVGNVDSNNAKYIATARVQTGRQEIIEDLDDTVGIGGLVIATSRHRRRETRNRLDEPRQRSSSVTWYLLLVDRFCILL